MVLLSAFCLPPCLLFGAEPFSFGGLYGTKSKYGDCDITGDGAMEFFSNRIKVTSKWTASYGSGAATATAGASAATAGAAGSNGSSNGAGNGHDQQRAAKRARTEAALGVDKASFDGSM